MNRDRFALRTAQFVIGLTLFANMAEAEHGIPGPVTDRPPNAARWTNVFRLPDNTTYYGGCGFPDYGIDRRVGYQGYLEAEPRTEPNYRGCEESCLYVPQPNRVEQNQAAPGGSTRDLGVLDAALPIGTGVVIYEAEVTTVDAVVLSRFVPNSLETGYDRAYDEAMCGLSGKIDDSTGDVPTLWTQWPLESLPDLAHISRAAKDLRIVKAWQRAYQIALRPNMTGIDDGLGVAYLPNGVRGTAKPHDPNRQLLLEAADALDGVGSAISSVAANLRAWAVDERTARNPSASY